MTQPARNLVQRVFGSLQRRWDVAHLAGPRLLRAFADQFPEAFFIQVGANDGVMMDPIRATILTHPHWRGLAIEPVPHLFAKLQSNYTSIGSRVRLVNAAVAESIGPLPFYHLARRPGLPSLPSWAEGLGSFRRDVVLKHIDRIPDLEQYLTKIEVPGITWSALCQKHAASQVDLVMTDTEGYDFEIIRQIDFKTQPPRLLVFEHHHFSDETQQSCRALLKGYDYQLFTEGLDTWCLHQNRTDAGQQRLVKLLPKLIRASRFASAV